MIAAPIVILVALAGSAPLAEQQTNGDIEVWQPGDDQRVIVDHCADRAALAWVEQTLYLACPGRSISRWTPGQARAKVIANPSLQRLAWSAIAGGSALYVADMTALWRYRPDFDLLEKIADLPEPVTAVSEGAQGIIVRGRRAWLWRSRRWRPIEATPRGRKNDLGD